MAPTTAATRTARAPAGPAAPASSGTRRSSTATAAPATPRAAGGWARTTSAGTQTGTCSRGATWLSQRRASTGATATSPHVTLAGVEAGYACFCGSESDLARARPAPATDCDQICFGHPGQLCGGDGRLGIYEVSVGSCQGNWTAPQGVLYSPDFPDEYGPDGNCSWTLRPPGAALELTFRLFELADPRDRLELRDAASGILLRTFDGARPPPPGPLRLRTSALLLRFRSDARGQGQGFALTYRGLQDAAEDRAPPKGSAQAPGAPPDGANVSCSPQPGTPEAAMGARVFSSVTAVALLLLLLLSLLRLRRRRSCLPAQGKGPPALGPSPGPGRGWAVWYRRPRGVALPRAPGDPPAEALAPSYRPLSASSQSSLRSLISAL
ncbi:kremen protein 2 isoform X3 [Erinaceus europaeus]|uniref:Kremen protein 2 isoform X3 n=1 Tax=Erinaceus europaeus TaxID=9365 RepID=A0ABM3VW36_ERIEU|nr:kremen protein 2 isoform X3 [Erinaceus europaeus]